MEQRADHAAAAHAMIAQDARWIGDSLLSTTNFPASASAVSLALFGHSARIVYEGGRFVRSAIPETGLAALAELLPDEFAPVIQRARHATKLLDDNKKSVGDLCGEMDSWLSNHQKEFYGNSIPAARFLESDLGLFRLDGHLLLATVLAQFRLGAEPGTDLEGLGPFMHDLAAEHGASLSVLAAVSGDATPVTATQDYDSLGTLNGHDVRSEWYFARRFDLDLSTATKLLLTLVESEVTTADKLLSVTSHGHEDAVFRARFVSVFHTLSAISTVLSDHRHLSSKPIISIRETLAANPAKWMLSDPSARRLRNQCVHYAVRESEFVVDWEAPMFGLVPVLTGGRSYQEVDEEVTQSAVHLSNALHDWVPESVHLVWNELGD